MSENNENNNIEEEKKEIEVVEGDGKDLDISPVYSHIKIDKPDTGDKNKEEIVVPKSNSSKK